MNGVVNRLLMVISWFGKVPMKRRTVVGAHADADEVHGQKFSRASAIPRSGHCEQQRFLSEPRLVSMPLID